MLMYVLTTPRSLLRLVRLKTSYPDIPFIPYLAVPKTNKTVEAVYRKYGRSKEETSNRMSFAAILRKARDMGESKVLICEDDVYFKDRPGISASENFRKALAVAEDLPTDFGIYLLGTYFRQMDYHPKQQAPVNVRGKVFDLSTTNTRGKATFWGAHAVVFGESVYDKCITNYEAEQGQITDEYMYRTLIRENRCFVATPMVAFQRHDSVGMHGKFNFTIMEKLSQTVLSHIQTKEKKY